jgi:hypothetical protein
MTTTTWTGGAGNNNWADGLNWDYGAPGFGDSVILPSLASDYKVNLSSLANLSSLSVGSSGALSGAVTLVLGAGASLSTVGKIVFGYNATIMGDGALNASSGFDINFNGAGNAWIYAGLPTGGGAADGAQLTLTGVILNSAINLGFANDTKTTTFTIGTSPSATLKDLQITSGLQTFEVAASVQVSFFNSVSVTGGEILLDGNGAKFAAGGGGILLSGGASLVGTGTFDAAIYGNGYVKATSGTLTLTNGVDGLSSAEVPHLIVIGDGTTLQLTSSVGIGDASGYAPTLEFRGAAEIFRASNAAMNNVYLGTISGFAETDLIFLKAFGAGDTLSYNLADHSITISNSGGSQTFYFSADTAVDQIQLTQQDSSTVDRLTICFVAGTSIRTPTGEALIESLSRGDLVLTADGVARPVVWVGRQTIVTRFADPVRNWPIRIAAGALADKVPLRDLLVSPDHALLVDGVLAHAGALVNGSSIRRERQAPERFVYFHIELEDHSLILAENVPAETFVDNVDRRNFDNWEEHQALYPEGRAVEELPLPRAKSRRQLPNFIRVALDERAASLAATAAA